MDTNWRASKDPQTIDGVKLLGLKMNRDLRGAVTEIYRQKWIDERMIKQINFSFATEKTLRGIHTHMRQWDFIVNVQGNMRFALVDFRRVSPTFMKTVMFDMDSAKLEAIIIPPGVGHGFYF